LNPPLAAAEERAPAATLPGPVILLSLIALAGLLTLVFQAKIAGKMPDFEVYYRAGTRFLARQELYLESDGHFQFKYPPVAATLFAPLGRLSLRHAKLAWFFLSSSALLASLWLCAGLVGVARPARGLVLGLTLLVEAKFYGHELTLGQVNALLLLLLVLALRALVADRPIRAGILLGLTTAIKPYGLIFIPYLVLKRRFRSAMAAVVSIALLAVAPTVLYGWRGSLGLLESWRGSLARSTPSLLTSNDNVSLAGFWAKHLGAESPWLAPAVGLTALVMLSVFAATTWRSDASRTALLIDVSVLMISMPLLSPLGWDYVFLWSTPGVMILIAAWWTAGPLQRIAVATGLALVGATVYDVLGRTLYRHFMALSILTPVFLLIIGLLLVERRRVGAVAPPGTRAEA
jgi:hypothetical protein